VYYVTYVGNVAFYPREEDTQKHPAPWPWSSEADKIHCKSLTAGVTNYVLVNLRFLAGGTDRRTGIGQSVCVMSTLLAIAIVYHIGQSFFSMAREDIEDCCVHTLHTRESNTQLCHY
jgi:hypothetical protein